MVGPVYIDGAEPSDAVKVTLLSFAPSGWGWTGNIPGFGLLADQFPEPALRIWKYDVVSLAPAMYGPGGRVPLKPFCGTIGLAPAESGLHTIVPPRRVGGNMDIRDICTGTELYLPVEVKGGLFSVGDPHAAQGDGEICGTAIESPVSLAARFELIKEANLTFPRFTTASPVSRHLDTKGYEVTTGIGPCLQWVESRRWSTAAIGQERTGIHKTNRPAIAPTDSYEPTLVSPSGDVALTRDRRDREASSTAPHYLPTENFAAASSPICRPIADPTSVEFR